MSDTPTHDDLRADGVVPDDDIVRRIELSETTEAAMDGNGTVHLCDPREEPPRERKAALSPRESDRLAEWLAES